MNYTARLDYVDDTSTVAAADFLRIEQGIADAAAELATVETPAGAQAKADAAETDAISAAAVDATTKAAAAQAAAVDAAAADAAVMIAAAQLLATNNQTVTNYTLVLADAGKVVERNNAAANTVTIPPASSVAFPVGTVIEVWQQGAGQTTIVAGSGVTITKPASLTLALTEQGSSVSLRKRAADEWVVSGDLAGV